MSANEITNNSLGNLTHVDVMPTPVQQEKLHRDSMNFIPSGLHRRNAVRLPAGSTITTVNDGDGCELSRSNAVRRANTKTFGQADGSIAGDIFEPGEAKSLRKVVTEYVNHSSARQQTVILRRPSRFVEHMTDDVDTVSVRSSNSRDRIAYAVSKLKAKYKNVTYRRPSYTGVQMYEGT